MGEQIPYLEWRPAHQGDEASYAIATVLDEITVYALANECPEDQLRDRLDESIERAEEA